MQKFKNIQKFIKIEIKSYSKKYLSDQKLLNIL
jgi:hypothetical protein